MQICQERQLRGCREFRWMPGSGEGPQSRSGGRKRTGKNPSGNGVRSLRGRSGACAGDGCREIGCRETSAREMGVGRGAPGNGLRFSDLRRTNQARRPMRSRIPSCTPDPRTLRTADSPPGRKNRFNLQADTARRRSVRPRSRSAAVNQETCARPNRRYPSAPAAVAGNGPPRPTAVLIGSEPRQSGIGHPSHPHGALPPSPLNRR